MLVMTDSTDEKDVIIVVLANLLSERIARRQSIIVSRQYVTRDRNSKTENKGSTLIYVINVFRYLRSSESLF